MSKTATKPKPIIFSAESVRAILEDRKTQTRRVVKPQPNSGPNGKMVHLGDGTFGLSDGDLSGEWTAPYQPGDVLWVRETWCEYGKGRAIYRANYGNFTPISDGIGGPWRSPIHMPRWAARLWIEITDVRGEQLQEISAGDVNAEGFPVCIDAPSYEAFAIAWDALNAPKRTKRTGRVKSGTRNYPWESNPWVWCYTFKRVEAP